jgi:uncharacterized protein
MIIRVYDIQESISVKGTVDGSGLKRPEDADLTFLSPIEYELRVSRVGDNVRIQGPVEASLSLTCDRCLEPYAFTVRSVLDIELMPKEKQPKVAEMELQADEMDVYYFEGEEIEIDPYVFEEIMLNIPIKVLCSDACKGMCPVCGKNLNIEECRCEKTGTSALGEKLKSFLKER